MSRILIIGSHTQVSREIGDALSAADLPLEYAVTVPTPCSDCRVPIQAVSSHEWAFARQREPLFLAPSVSQPHRHQRSGEIRFSIKTSHFIEFSGHEIIFIDFPPKIHVSSPKTS